MRTLHLFAGAGGGLLADLILGHTPVCAVEWDAYCCAVLRERAADDWFPGLHVHEGDVRLFDPSPWAGRVDCLHAGFPCQPFSVAGSRKGTLDSRELFGDVLRCVAAIRPKHVFLENSPGVLTSRSPSCVCGWPHRRGGLRSPSAADNQADVHGRRAGVDVGQGESPTDEHARNLRWSPLRAGLQAAGVGHANDMAYQWGLCRRLSPSDSPILDSQERTGGDRLGARRPAPGGGVDGDDASDGGGDEGEDSGVEQEGACPECGRLVSARRGSVWYYSAILESLAALGYDARWLVLGADDVGAPHRRERWWCRAWRNETGGQPHRGPTDADCARVCSERGEPAGAAGEARPSDGVAGVLGEVPDAAGERRGEGRAEPNAGRPTDAGGGAWWESEPDVGRVAHGVAARARQIAALGNGQVPLCAAAAWRLLGGPMTSPQSTGVAP
ncbi:DNA cytosine methyltransferase [Methylibium sp.]|uniref:DNA cytosine methyltransferase n=1 Tax=Methylibium sp. TaxID=2067992 RepID=UPI00185151FC|nr:DNA cytosine methyltransferase [Methylibium sp.]